MDRNRTRGAIEAVAAVALVTALIYPLREVAPVVSTGPVYLIAVLAISIRWGLAFGVLTAVASALAFNFFHLPPTGRLTIAEDENWVALAVFLIVAVVASRLAEDSRNRAVEAERRRREADLLAELATVLLASTSAEEARAVLAARLSDAFALGSAQVELRTVAGDDRRLDLALAADDDRLGTLLVPRDTPPATLTSLRRLAPALAVLLVAARRREALEAEVVETRALRRSDVVKTALLRAVSHDLRSPLTAIVTASDGLRGDQGDAELIEVVRGESARLARLVDDLLDISRIEAGSAPPRLDWVAVDEVVEAAVRELPADAAVELALAADLPLVRADAAQLERALANLLANAWAHGGGAAIRIEARAAAHRLRLRVSDHGPGIPRERLERVFEPFYRGEGGAGHTGSGLGLAIARGFVEAVDGRVWAESLPGQGATFVIELPLRANPQPAAAEAGETA